MNSQAAITVHRDRDGIERLWATPDYRAAHIQDLGATVTFKDAPGDRGTEIHVGLATGRGPIARLRRTRDLAKVKDDLRRFKARVETGLIPRSDSTPEGERFGRKLKQRPARPMDEEERAKAGVA